MAKKESVISWKSQKKNSDKIMLTMKKEKGERVREAAKKSGKSCNAFIIDIVLEYIENNQL